jgi:hypothetical protein
MICYHIYIMYLHNHFILITKRHTIAFIDNQNMIDIIRELKTQIIIKYIIIVSL